MSTKNLLQIISSLLVVTMVALAQTSGQRPELKLNEIVERELSKGQTHEYQVTLKPGEFMQVRVEQKGVDVVLSICTRKGKQLLEMDSPNGEEGFEILSFKANDAGIYLVRIGYLDQTDDSRVGRYAIRLAEKRPSTPHDVIRIDAEHQLRAVFKDPRITDVQMRAAVEKYEGLLPVWGELKDEYIIGFLESLITSTKESIADWESEKSREAEEAKSREKQEAKKNAAIERRLAKVKLRTNIPQPIVPTGHVDTINSIAFSKDGKLLASVAGDNPGSENTIKLWDVTTGKELKVLSGHSAAVNSVAFSSDGRFLASGSGDDTVKLWDVATGQETKSLKLDAQGAKSVAFSPDGKILAASGFELVKLWDVRTAKELKTIEDDSMGTIYSIAFSKDGKLLAGGGFERIIKLWDVTTGKERRALTGHTGRVHAVRFSPTDKILASGSSDDTIKLWDSTTGQLLKTLNGHKFPVEAIDFSASGNVLVSGSIEGDIKLWDVLTGRIVKTLGGRASSDALSFSPDGKTLASGGFQNIILWDIATGKKSKVLEGHTELIRSISFSPNGQFFAIGTLNGLQIWDMVKGRALQVPNHDSIVGAVAFSPNGNTLALGLGDEPVTLFDLTTLKELKARERKEPEVESLVFSPDATLLVLLPEHLGERNTEITLWNVVSGQDLRSLKGHTKPVESVAFSPDGKTLASGGWDETIKLWDVLTGQELRTLKGHNSFVQSVAFSFDGRLLVSGSSDKTIKLWDVATGQELKTFIGHAEDIESVRFLADGKTLVSMSEGKEIKFWNIATGQEVSVQNAPPPEGKLFDNVIVTPGGKILRADVEGNVVVLRDTETEDEVLTLVVLTNEDEETYDWAVIDSDGRWDASDGAQKQMYYTLPTTEGYEIIDFSQLKERYYEPGLLPKLLGYNKEPLKDVAQFKDVLLPPAVEPINPKDPKSTVRQVKLRNRKGGIGRVQVFVNGREFIDDARDTKLRSNPNLKDYVLSFDLKNAAFTAGQKPDVRVVAWNYDPNAKERYQGYISSRGTEVVYTPDEEKNEPPSLYAIIAGVSHYKGKSLDLRFADKDADNMYQAIKVGGRNLFGVDRVKLKLLSTSGNVDAILPTKENFRQAFAEFAKEAKPNDVFFVYLAGHGITLNLGSNNYYYLVQEATTTDQDVLRKDSALLSSSTINSEELTQWHKSVKAQKQVLILDTCAAGSIGSDFKIAEQRQLSSDAKRAIENMRDRVGFHVLMGSAENSASYEASQYGEGLLTYSLLQGMKGAALQPDGQIDVSKLFNYAADTVPSLAKNIGGIQRPEIRVPIGGTSFAFGLIQSDDDKRQIPLAQVKPVVLRPKLQNQAKGFDDLKLEPLLRDRLRQASYSLVSGNASSGLVFVDTDEMPGAIVPSGNYVIEGDVVRLRINLLVDYNPAATIVVDGAKSDLNALVDHVLRAISVESQKLRSP